MTPPGAAFDVECGLAVRAARGGGSLASGPSLSALLRPTVTISFMSERGGSEVLGRRGGS